MVAANAEHLADGAFGRAVEVGRERERIGGGRFGREADGEVEEQGLGGVALAEAEQGARPIVLDPRLERVGPLDLLEHFPGGRCTPGTEKRGAVTPAVLRVPHPGGKRPTEPVHGPGGVAGTERGATRLELFLRGERSVADIEGGDDPRQLVRPRDVERGDEAGAQLRRRGDADRGQERLDRVTGDVPRVAREGPALAPGPRERERGRCPPEGHR